MTGARFDILDFADPYLPVLDEPVPASFGQYSKSHTKAWAEAVAKYDGYVFVTVDELRLEVRSIHTFLESYHPERVDEIFRSLHDKRKPLVKPARLLDADYIKQWTSVAYEKKGFAEDAPELESCT